MAGAAIPPGITGDLSALDPASNAADKNALTAVQERYNQLREYALKAQRDETLSQTLDKLGTQLTTQAISVSQQLSFSGKAKDLIPFLTDVEKHVFLATGGRGDMDLRRAVYQFSRGTVSDFVRGLVDANQDFTWDNLKTRLIERFGERLDPQTLLIKLRHYAQRPGQSIAVFAELIHNKAVPMYKGDINVEFAQRELVSILVKGLRNKNVTKKVLIEHPNKFHEAVESAIDLEEKETRLSAHGLTSSFDGGHRHKPMEVDFVKKKKPWHRSGKPQEHRRFDNSEQRDNSQRKCFKCGKSGHFQAQCRSKSETQPKAGRTDSQCKSKLN